MQAAEIMTRTVITVSPDATVPEIARLLLDHRISAVPVVDHSGQVVGMISEGDLIGRDAEQRRLRRDWWLDLLAEGTTLSPDFLDHTRRSSHTARQVMTAPALTAGDHESIEAIATLLDQNRIKRVPILRDGKLVGIVSRADLLRAMAQSQPEPDRSSHHGGLSFFHHGEKSPTKTILPTPAALSADGFRALSEAFKHELVQRRIETEKAKHQQRIGEVEAILTTHLAEPLWEGLLDRARQAAAQGQAECLLLRFPSEACSDGGRAINAPEPDWPTTLRGEAAELYSHWERELRPQGFGLSARIIDFPGGMPGDVGLFLTWGGAA